jgi:very-short-patch-repair endonuclease
VDVNAEHAQRLFDFLAETSELRTKPVRTLDDARRILWFDELPEDFPGLQTFLTAAGGPWISLTRVDPPDAPSIPPTLVPWLDERAVRDFSVEQAPALREQTDEIMDDEQRLGVRQSLVAVYEAWAGRWESWAEERRRLAPAVMAYNELYAMALGAREDSELFELVLGFGYATQRSGRDEVRRHVVTAAAVAAYDLRTGAITVGPDPAFPELALEEDMLDVGDRATPSVAAKVGELLEEAEGFEAASGSADSGDSALESLHEALGTWTRAAGPDGRYRAEVDRHPPRYDRGPVVSFAPALILRRRGSRSLVQALRGISSLIGETGQASGLIEFLIDPATSSREAADTDPLASSPGPGADPDAASADEVYFSLPSNAEQTSIARRLRDERLVVVQGPPGTGKTHTIANLVTDLLAHGKRVLITSHTARALKVLRDKLPEELQHLCVSRTDDGVAGQQELESSVKGILARHGTHDPGFSAAEIKRLTGRLREARTRQADALLELRTVREMDTFVYSADIGDYTGTPSQVAERLRREAGEFEWIGEVPEIHEDPEDVFTDEFAGVLANEFTSATLAETLVMPRSTAQAEVGVSTIPPRPSRAPEELTTAEAAALRQAALAYTPDLAARHAELPPAESFPAPAAFADAVARIRDADRLAAEAAQRHGAGLVAAVRALPDQRRDILAGALDPFLNVRDHVAAYRLPWVADLRAQVIAGQDNALRRRRAATQQAVADIAQYAPHLGAALISGLERFDLPTALHYAKTLYEGYQAGQKLKGPLGIKTKFAKDVEPFHDLVRVDGAPLDTPDQCLRILYRVEIERRLLDVEQSWGGRPEPWGRHETRTGRLEDDLGVLDLLAQLAERHQVVGAAVAVSPELARLDWLDPSVTDLVRDVLTADEAVRDTAQARRTLAESVQTLRAWAADQRHVAPAVSAATDALAAPDPEAYQRAHDLVADVRDAADAEQALDRARAVVAAKHPALAAAIEDTADDPAWDGRLKALPRAWAWSRWNTRLVRLTDPEAEKQARDALSEADGEVRLSLSRLAEARAWNHCLQRITAEQGRALQAYQLNIRRIGKGTGKHAHRYRALARENLREAQEAVPAWIMPLHQVVASVPMDRPELFDVVIVDEASQSGLEAVLLAHVAERMVVVGDDKQVSPSNVGLDQDQVFGLQERMLSPLPRSIRGVINPMTSLFDLTSALAAGRGRLMLKEHFRCMPEIIDFSNRQFYGGELQPLRQYGTDRLPPIVTRYVGGVIEGSGTRAVNRAEAEALVDAVVECCEDDAYAGLSMGVITMLGGGQTALIEDLLAERLSVATRQARGLRVGNAEAFQGDERQVVFLSLVVSRASIESDELRRIGGFSAENAQQRLNVAASRAQDQIQVFHSVHPGDLGPTDLRRAYLEYLAKPPADQDAHLSGEVSPDVRRAPFDSLFEQRVYLALKARGFRVRPQCPAGRYRIDLVVEGGTRRLAVECDGDAYHGEDDAEADAARQRDLERVGWRFVRIRGSRFFRDPEAALEPLWRELARLGIDSRWAVVEG